MHDSRCLNRYLYMRTKESDKETSRQKLIRINREKKKEEKKKKEKRQRDRESAHSRLDLCFACAEKRM